MQFVRNALTRAETEGLRTKQALKMAESRLEDERRRRLEAEHAADEEARMRRQVEDQYRALQMQMQGGRGMGHAHAHSAHAGLTSPL